MTFPSESTRCCCLRRRSAIAIAQQLALRHLDFCGNRFHFFFYPREFGHLTVSHHRVVPVFFPLFLVWLFSNFIVCLFDLLLLGK